MEEGTVTSAVPGQRHVIERPRLTSMLDASNARIILLIAPAGYGKTTLARQWFATGDKQVAWYRATQASADVAALATGLARAVDAFAPGVSDAVVNGVRASVAPSERATDLAELLASHFPPWPDDAWIVIDDYHLVGHSQPAETFVEVLADRTNGQVLIASRSRPSWVTTRNLLYGEISEFTQSDLAFTPAEARELLPAFSAAELKFFVERSRGWPAVVRLASVSGDTSPPATALAPTLHEYFAEELFSAARPALQDALVHLVLLPTLSDDLLEVALGDRHKILCKEAADAGFLTIDQEGRYEFHPLLRQFLAPRTRVLPDPSVCDRIIEHLTTTARWDEAFEVVESLNKNDLLASVLASALDDLLQASRVSTLEVWLEYAARHACEDPIYDLAEAELARRSGLLELGEARALQAARHLDPSDPNCSRAWTVAGECAHLMTHAEDAIAFHERAEELAPHAAAARRAVWGRYVTAVQFEIGDPEDALARLRALDDGSAALALRIAAGELHLATILGGIRRATRRNEQQLALVDRVEDPLLITSFLSRLAWLSIFGSDYALGMRHAERAMGEAKRTRTTFAIVHLTTPMIAASIGLRRFRHAEILLHDLESHLAEAHDVYEETNLRIFRARLRLSRASPMAAASELELERIAQAPAVGLALEAVAVRALADAILGEDTSAGALEGACQRSAEVQGQTLAGFARFVYADVTGVGDASALLRSAVETLLRSENFDSFVLAYRAYPPLLAAVVAENLLSISVLETVLHNAMDISIAQAVGITLPKREPGGSLLTRREREVYELLCKGLSNREIGESLFITETTVKVHVRHILEKLGVRTRTQAMRLAHEAL